MSYNSICLDKQNTEALCFNKAAQSIFSQSDIVSKAPSMSGLTSSAVCLGNGSSAHGGHFAMSRKKHVEPGIYVIENIMNGHIYIGSAVNISGRKRSHLSALRSEKHHNIHLQRAWKKYGEESFRFVILEQCEPGDLVGREQYWIDIRNPEYNIAPKAGSNFGVKHSEETRRKVSMALKGNKYTLGYKHSEETKRKVSAAGKGRKVSEENKEKFRIRNIGNTHALGIKRSAETKEKMSVWQRGRTLPEETKAKLRAANQGKLPWNTGKHRSEETKMKLRAANLGRKDSESTKQKKSMALKGNTYGRALKGIPHSEEHKQHIAEAKARKKAERDTK